MAERIGKIITLQKIYEEVMFGIIRTDSQESAVAVSDVLIGAGLRVLEVSLTTPGALSAIEVLVNKNQGTDVVIGAGTVLDETSARLAIDAGSRFIVSPNLNKGVVMMGNRYGIPVMPGIGTVSELITAMEWGVDVVKCFPGGVLGSEFVKSLRNPVPQARVIPVGGVAKDNLQKWLECGAYALGIGAGLTHPNGSCANLELVERNASELLKLVENEKHGRR